MVTKFHLLKLDVICKNRLTFISSSKVKNTFLWNITTGSSEIKNNKFMPNAHQISPRNHHCWWVVCYSDLTDISPRDISSGLASVYKTQNSSHIWANWNGLWLFFNLSSIKTNNINSRTCQSKQSLWALDWHNTRRPYGPLSLPEQQFLAINQA